MLACHLLPVERMSDFITRRRSIEQSPFFAVVSHCPLPQLSGHELAIQTLHRLDRLSDEGIEIPKNLRSRVWATACSFSSAGEDRQITRLPWLAGLLLSEGILPTELDGLPTELIKQLNQLAQMESETIKNSQLSD